MMAITVIFLPWVVGALALMYLFRSVRAPGAGVVAAGVGGWAGFVTASLVIWISDVLGVVALADELVLFLTLGGVTLIVLHALPWAKGRVANLTLVQIESSLLFCKPLCRLSKIIAALLLILIAWNLYALTLQPAAGWDVLDHWAKEAKRFVYYRTDAGIYVPFDYWDKHPLTGSMLLAWFAWVVARFDGAVSPMIGWFGIQLSFLLVVFGFSLYQTRSCLVAVLASYIAMSIPLTENHSLIAGYMELPLLVSVASSAALLAIGYQEKRKVVWITALLPILFALLLKNIGLVFGFLVIIAFAAAWVRTYISTKLQLQILVALTALIFVMANIGFELQLGWQPVGYDPHERKLILGGHRLALSLLPLTDFLSIEVTSRLLNLSFSTSFLSFMVLIFFIETSERNRGTVVTRFMCSLIALGFLVLVMSLFTNIGYNHANPGSDTGHSRFTVSFISIVALLLPIAMARKVKNEQT